MVDDGPAHIRDFDLERTAPGTIGRYWLQIVGNKLGAPFRLPVLVARGTKPGPVLGLTAAIHGNELNGISVIQRVFGDLDPQTLSGTVVGVLVVNVPGLLQERREFNDGQDLNRIAPGRADGNMAQVYIHRFIDRVLRHFDFHIDLHTASFGRVNSYYVRADMKDDRTARMAILQDPQIIVDNAPGDGTLRGAASALGIPSITVELRDPHRIQASVVGDSEHGILSVLADLGMCEGSPFCPTEEIWLCERSYWIHTDESGILAVMPRVAALVEKDETVATVHTIFGDPVRRYTAPEAGIVVGKSINPLNQTGSRILHLGVGVRTIPAQLPD